MDRDDRLDSKENYGMKLPITRKLYLLGLGIIFVASYSQYLVRGLGLFLGELVVYGIPFFAASSFLGLVMIKKAFRPKFVALKFGLAFFGAFTVLGTLAGAAVFYVIATFDPAAVSLLHRPNPVLHIPPEFAWTMVWNSFIIVGPAEEYLFRGFVYGGLLSLFKGRHWVSLAFISSVLFALAHLYYALVYGIASLVQFTDLIAFGMAMAFTYYLSGGNLLVPALIHGAYDATGFIGVATSTDIGMLLRAVMILAGVIASFALFILKMFGSTESRQENARKLPN